MFRKNQHHLQPALMSDLDHLTEKQRRRLDESWAGTFRREVFARLDEAPFATLYADTASRPNIPVNVLVGLETLKAGHGWSDEDLHDAFSFDVQVRYAIGYENLGEGEFDLRTVYNFRQRVSAHMQEQGENLIDRAFTQVTDEQLAAFQLKTGQLRMDSSQVASNIRQACRVQLLVEVLQRVQRMLTSADQARYADAFAPYVKGHASQYIYRLKGEQTAPHLQRIGELMHRLLDELRATYAADASYQMLERVFGEQFRLSDNGVATIPGTEISASSLRSPDDPEATYRKKGHQSYQGYVTNVTETCAPENPFQLIVQVQTAPNTTEDAALLIEAVPALKARTGVETIYNDAAFCSPAADEVLREHHIEQVPTDLRGKSPNPERLGLADFAIQCDADAIPAQITCPQHQSVPVSNGRKPHRYVARFDSAVCQVCTLQARCPTRALAS
ncbi:MAG: transposase, partial [Chloroflexi bacterium]|nr:transposase [Chloroflexota bacterium]